MAVAAREIREKSFIFAGALLAGLLPIAIAWLGPGAQGNDVRNVAALVLAASIGGVLALMLGSTSIGAELAEGRMGFFFSRPLSSLAIWAGKTAAAALLVLGSILLVVLPATLAGGGLRSLSGKVDHRVLDNYPLPDFSDWQLVALGGAVLLILLAFSQAAGIAFRSRSKWLAVDAFCFAAVLALVFDAGRRLFLASATVCLAIAVAALLLGFIVAVPVACFAGVRAGRVSLVRTHRWLSLVIWAFVLPISAGIEGYSAWVLSPCPNDLRSQLEVFAASEGPWVWASGVARGRFDFQSRFLLNTTTRDFIRLGDSDYRNWRLTFDELGSRAAWVEPDGQRLDLFTADLSARVPRKAPTRISFSGRAPDLVLSRDGKLLATLDRFNVAVLTLPEGRLVASAAVPRKQRSDIANIDALGCRATFLGPDRLRIYAVQPSTVSPRARELEIYELDFSRGKVTKTGQASFETVPLFLTDQAAERILARELSTRQTTLLDARTGALISTIAPEGESGRWADFLSDGRLALVESHEGRMTATIFSPSGRDERKLELGAGYRPYFGEIEPARLIVEFDAQKRGSEPSKHVLLDLANGASRKLPAGELPNRWRRVWQSDPAAAPRPGSLSARLLVERHGASIVELDPATGARRTIIPGR
jgi:hypothetical protein